MGKGSDNQIHRGDPMSRRFLVLAVAAVAIGHLDILVAIGCGAVVIWFAQRRRRAVAG